MRPRLLSRSAQLMIASLVAFAGLVVSGNPLVSAGAAVLAVAVLFILSELQRVASDLYWRRRAIARDLPLVKGLLLDRDFLGVYNHVYFHSKLRREFERAEAAGHEVSLIVIRIPSLSDRPDEVDGLQRQIAIEVSSVCKSATDYPGDFVVRWGANAFTLVMPGSGPVQASRVQYRVAQQLRSALEDTAFEIGTAVYPRDGRQPEMVVRSALTPKVRDLDEEDLPAQDSTTGKSPVQVHRALSYTLIIHRDPQGEGYKVIVPALPGCVARGSTIHDALDRGTAAVAECLKRLKSSGAAIGDEPEHPQVVTIAVTV